ncbi:uncharacterized protein [Amphiura filiformis]|uniref:uncharacterized protein isoform X3 n=1 Tax=Amphiura filiformis TaxID=82378 RepID=UPI003B213A4B
MAGKQVEEVKFLHAGVPIEILRQYGVTFENVLKLPGQAEYTMKCARGLTAFYQELQSVHARLEGARHNDGRGGLLRAVLLYSKEFFQLTNHNSNPDDVRRIAVLLGECLAKGYIAELVIDDSIRPNIEEFFTHYGVQRPPQAKPVVCSSYIPMEDGAFIEAIYKQWFGPAARLSDAYGGVEAMDIDDDDKYIPEEVRIIHYGLNRDDILRPLGRAFEDDVGVIEQVQYTSHKKGNKDPSQIILRDMRNVKDYIGENGEKAHGVLMWDASFMNILQQKADVKKAVEELLQQDNNIPRQFANVLMKDVELSHFQAFSPSLYKN